MKITSRGVLFVVIVGVLALVLSKDGQEAQNSGGTWFTITNPGQVPSIEVIQRMNDIVLYVVDGDPLPSLDEASLKEGINLLRSMESSPHLQTSEDRAMFGLLHSYFAREGGLPVMFYDPTAHADLQGAKAGAAYHPRLDMFMFSPRQESLSFGVAISMYHELAHALESIEWMAAAEIRDREEFGEFMASRKQKLTVCAFEGIRGHAAGARMFAALMDAGKVPTTYPTNTSREDAGSLINGVFTLWAARLNGDFCETYNQVVKTGKGDVQFTPLENIP